MHEVIATIDGQLCKVLGIQISGFVTSLKLRLPQSERPKTAQMAVSSATKGASISFLFEYADACAYEQFCAKIRKIPDVATLISTEPHIECNPGMCIYHEDIPVPRVLAGTALEGLTSGGDVIDILVSNLETEKSSGVLVFFSIL